MDPPRSLPYLWQSQRGRGTLASTVALGLRGHRLTDRGEARVGAAHMAHAPALMRLIRAEPAASAVHLNLS